MTVGLLLALDLLAAPVPAPDKPAPLDCTGKDGVSPGEVRKVQEAWAKFLHRKVEETVEVGDGLTITFVLVPPGKFLMGSPKREQDYVTQTYYGGKRPASLNFEILHEVTLTEPFDLGKTEVTQGQYKALGLENPSIGKQDDHPVGRVSWEEAYGWAGKLTKKRTDKYLYRLPTEAEWEFACRGGHPSSMPFGVGNGRTLSFHEANFDGEAPYGGAGKGKNPHLATTCAVASYPANALGLNDMHGNVMEWCADWYALYPPGEDINPAGPEEGERRVARGGGWLHPSWNCRAAFRRSCQPSLRLSYLGFRLARSIPAGRK